MKLANAARWADKTELYDAYSPGKFLFKAQVSSYIDNQLDGAISKRRVISYAPGLELPARRAITYGEDQPEIWLVGDQLQDFWKGKPLRVSAATKRVTGLYSICTALNAVSLVGAT